MKTISDIRLNPQQTDRLHVFYRTLITQGISVPLAYQGARIVIQDEILGVEARTLEQQRYAQEIQTLVTQTYPITSESNPEIWNPLHPPELRPPMESTTVKPVPYYLDTHITQTLCNTYGSRLEQMYKLSKLAFRGALSLYTVWRAWPNSAEAPKMLMLQVLDSVDSALENDDADVFDVIVASANLPPDHIEKLILALTDQIEQSCWSDDPQSQSGPTADPFDVVVSVTQ